MSTNCRIGLINTDGSVDSIYCHNDGYPAHQIPVLKTYYNSAKRVKALLALGDISCLYEYIAPVLRPETHSFDNPEPNVVVAYHRDRGEAWTNVEPHHFNNSTAEALESEYGCFMYLYDTRNNIWLCGYWKNGEKYTLSTFADVFKDSIELI